MLFFTVVPVALGLVAAALMHGLPRGSFSTVARTVLFIPQVIPLVAAGIVWDWVYSSDGIANQLLSAIGLGGITRPWLADFSTALPAVGLIGSWVMLGLCTLLLLTGITRIDPSLYEAARIDGASRLGEFRHVTLPGLRREIGVCLTVTMIAALASFDIIYISTQGGPGRSTMVPGVEIYRLAFTQREIGQASAMAVILMVVVLATVVPIQRYTQRSDA
nr:sugar ABC transporter permease [Nocardioides flavescens]